MNLLNFVEEDFVNYKKPSMFLGTSRCDGKCWREKGLPKETCQNHTLYSAKPMVIENSNIIQRYLNNPLTSAIVIGGLEPFMDIDEVYTFIKDIRSQNCNDDIVIYSGYYPEEISDKIDKLKEFTNIIIKFGRYIPNVDNHFDDLLGITLVSYNQYAKRIEDL